MVVDTMSFSLSLKHAPWPSVSVRVHNTFIDVVDDTSSEEEDEEFVAGTCQARRQRSHSCPRLSSCGVQSPLANSYSNQEILSSTGFQSPPTDTFSDQDPDLLDSKTDSLDSNCHDETESTPISKSLVSQLSDSPGVAMNNGFNATTTMMIRNIPCRCSKEDILSDINALGFEDTYDFFSLPGVNCGRSNMGFAFINFKAPALASAFQMKMKGRKLIPKARSSNSKKVCDVVVAAIQGLEQNWEHFEEKIHKRQWASSLFMPEPEKVECLVKNSEHLQHLRSFHKVCSQ